MPVKTKCEAMKQKFDRMEIFQNSNGVAKWIESFEKDIYSDKKKQQHVLLITAYENIWMIVIGDLQ